MKMYFYVFYIFLYILRIFIPLFSFFVNLYYCQSEFILFQKYIYQDLTVNCNHMKYLIQFTN